MLMNMLKEIVLGRTGLKIKILGFGAIPIQLVSEEEAVKVVRHCYDLGINYFDTARGYTVSEERIGKALEKVRDDVFIATKTANRTKKGALEELETSLKNLRTDRIDVYQLHNISSKEEWDLARADDGALQALYEAYDQGKILHLGVTSHDPGLLTEIIKEDIFETAMIPYNYLATVPGDELLPLCRRKSVGTVIMKPFGGGAFSNIEIALKFLLSKDCVDVVIPGMMSLREVDDNFAVAEGTYDLTKDDLETIDKDREELGSDYCRGCNYCQPCQQGIPISFVLRAEQQFIKRVGWADWLQEQYLKAEETVPSCVVCRECEERCPYSLEISEMLPLKLASLRKTLKQLGFA